MILQKEIEVIVNNNKIKLYQENGFPDCRRGDKIIIPIELLGKTSKLLIEYQCDYCGGIFKKAYGDLINGRKHIKKDCCTKCKKFKIEEVNYLLYGEKSTFSVPEYKEKRKRVIQEKYGVDNVMQVPEILEKQKESLAKHYGVKTPILNAEIKKQISETKVKRYGIEYVKNGILLINGVFCSQDQKEICNFFGFKINEIIDVYCVDGLKDNIIIEYNGGGHDLSVKSGKILRKDFNLKEEQKIRKLLELGYKILTIDNLNNLKITDNHYQDIGKFLQQLKDTDNNYIIYSIESSTTIESVSE